MERYRAKSGIVLTSVCGENLLVATKERKDLCPFMTSLNESGAFLWKRLLEGATEEELLAAVTEEYEVEDPVSLRQIIQDFLKQMKEMHYLQTQQEEQNEE